MLRHHCTIISTQLPFRLAAIVVAVWVGGGWVEGMQINGDAFSAFVAVHFFPFSVDRFFHKNASLPFIGSILVCEFYVFNYRN